MSLYSCESDCEKNCENGYCSNGICECTTGYTGKHCDQKISGGGGGGNSNCNYTPYYGNQNCSSSGYVAVSTTVCCSANYPYHNTATSSCYRSCEDAYSADPSGYISYGTGQTNSSNTGGGNTGGGNTGGGNTGGGGTGSGCDWTNALDGLSVVVQSGLECNNPNSKRVTVTNNYNVKVKLHVCVRKADGTYSGWGDITGTGPGESFSGYSCDGDGSYVIHAEFFDIYLANNYCSTGGCN